MNKTIIIRPEAEEEIKSALDWYNLQFPGLGTDFILSIDATLASIARYPFITSKIHKNIRRRLIKRFPFGIFYIVSDKNIIVLAILHLKRNPKIWIERN
jgi:plasmid stabilization system protein ParE